MEFWGAEVKSGEPLTVQPGDGMVLHLSQASLGELKKAESACLSVSIDGKKLVLGTLNSEKVPQQQFDLVFDRDFELSHNLKNGSVYFFGYKATNPFEEEEDDEDEEDESDKDIPLTLANNGKPEDKVKEAGKSGKASASGKQKVKIVEPSKDDEDKSSDDEMSEDEDDSEGDDEDDDSDESEEETPKKAEPAKKRKADSATKTPVTDKKAKLTTPQKTDGKKGSVHVATPHPSKQASKTPKSAGSHHCKPCNRSFGSESALESHSKAKHSAGK
ncbi:histone deacetylase HDT1 [Lycium ferocissimum]|uniref:histone deacetylase HDT1 n=1 Tax=Lycium ferocissimum TaxID=112874 RepID=UPI0028152F75|nr:histone deacetylase HDT1 [Lycium ferocissimum]